MLRELEAFSRQRRSFFYPKTDSPLADAVLHSLAARCKELDAEIRWRMIALCQRALSAEVVSVRRLGERGTFHLLYRVSLAGGRSVIVRVHVLSQVQRDFTLYLDSWVGGRLRGVDLPVLEVFHVAVAQPDDPFDYAIQEEAKGNTLAAFGHDETLMSSLLFQLGRIVARLHDIRTKGYGFLDLQPFVSGSSTEVMRGIWKAWKDYVLLNLDAHLRQCAAIDAVSSSEAQRIQKVFRSTEALLHEVEPVLLHGDLGNHNVFTNGATITALIDWEDCLSGDPVFDIAFWATFHPDHRRQSFLDGYRAERPLPADFELRFWLYYLRIALSKTVLRHRFRVTDQPGRAPAARRIQKGLERVEAFLGLC